MFGSNTAKNDCIYRVNTFFLKQNITKVKYNNVLINLPLSQHTHDLDNLTYSLENQVNTLFVFQEMGLGIFLTNYSAKKLPFYSRLIDNDLHYEKPSLYYINKSNYKVKISPNNWTGCKMVVFADKWDVHEWDYNKLIHLSTWINYLNPSQDFSLETYIADLGKSLNDSIDFKFLEAMGFDFQTLVS